MSIIQKMQPINAGQAAMIPASLMAAPAVRPLYCHKIPAGFPSPAADYTEKGLDLNTFLVQHKEATFFFRVAGECLTGIGIMDGDYVVVDRSVTAAHGHIILAVIDGEYTLKRLFHQLGVIELHPENPAFSPIRLVDGNELEVWGVVTGVVRKLRV